MKQDTGTFTKTEAQKRLRIAGRMARARMGHPANVPVDVGLRTDPVALPDGPGTDHSAHYGEHDDLLENWGMTDAASDPQVRAHGAIVHLYVQQNLGSVKYPEWELDDVVMAWLGTPDRPPVLVGRHAPKSGHIGRPTTPEDWGL